MSIGLATLRLDGFASVGGSFDGGRLTTRVFEISPGQLRVNAKADHGALRVELLDAEHEPLPGYGVDDCVAVEADGVDLAVRWRDVDRLPEGPARLRFHFTNARLYAYWGADSIR
jgi:hypothetical protein